MRDVFLGKDGILKKAACVPVSPVDGEWRSGTPPDGWYWIYCGESYGEKMFIRQIERGCMRYWRGLDPWDECRDCGMLWYSMPLSPPDPPSEDNTLRIMKRMSSEVESSGVEPCIACGFSGVCQGRNPPDGSDPCECGPEGCRSANGGWCQVCDLGHVFQSMFDGLAPGALPIQEVKLDEGESE